MAATALAQRQARTAPAPARSRRQAHRAPARPAATGRRPLRVVRTATAIGEAADSRLIIRLTRSQAWIAIIGALLIGIVALNVYSLAMGSAVSSTAERAADLERNNSLLREQIGRLKRNGEIESFAAKLGLGQPTSEQVIRIAAGKDDAAQAARRLTGAADAAAVAALPVAEVVTPEAASETTTPAAGAATDPTAAGVTDQAVTAPTETTEPAATADPAVTDPATDPTAAAAGGVSP